MSGASLCRCFLIAAVAGITAMLTTSSMTLAFERSLGMSCVRLFPDAGGEVLINACEVCRRVGVERTRPGAQFPTARTIIVPKLSRIELSFLGPGRTRLTGEEGCRDIGSGDAGASSSDGQRCVQFARSRGSHLLVNGCNECRVLAIQRTDPDGRQSRGAFKVGPRSALPYPAEGAIGAAIIDDMPCS